MRVSFSVNGKACKGRKGEERWTDRETERLAGNGKQSRGSVLPGPFPQEERRSLQLL